MTTGKPTKSIQNASRPNTVGLSKADLDRLLDAVDESGAKHDRRRQFVRWPYRQVSVHVTLTQPGSGSSVTLQMACRNLSCEGIGLLHNSFIHPGSQVTVELAKGGITLTAKGVVKRCSHIKGMVHELGIRFSEPIPAKDFVRAQSLTHCFSREQVDPASLAGTVIHAVESSADQRLFKHYLRETEIRLRPAASLKEAIDMMKDGCDLLLVDMDGPSDDVAQQFTAMRENGLTVPVVIVSADPSLATSTMFKTFKPDALLIKPVEQMMLLRAMAEHLGPGIGGAIASSLPEDHPNRPLVDGFVAQLGEYSKKIEAAQHAGDVKGCRAACLQVRSNAMALGFESLATLANNAAITLGATMSVEESGQPVRALLSACSRARAA